ncbi:MAG: hypothetical protein Q4C74_05215 [Rothia sp. (in: high G+C Gram-positive bacteria)]|nr:hypothetical protein [Rothia sp. (in: high G+C Gram-positive bacteria)]
MIRSFVFHVVNLILAILVYPGVAFFTSLIGLGVTGAVAADHPTVGVIFFLVLVLGPWCLNLGLLIYSIIGLCTLESKPRQIVITHTWDPQARANYQVYQNFQAQGAPRMVRDEPRKRV